MSRQVTTVRPACSTDVDRLVPLWSTLPLPGRGGGTPTSGSLAEGDLRARVTALLAEVPPRAVVAEVDGVVVGAAVLTLMPLSPLSDQKVLQTCCLAVDPAYRRRGIARAVIAHATQRAAELRAEQVVVTALPQDREANRFFARLGFAPFVVRRIAPVGALQRKLAGEPHERRLTVLARRRTTRARRGTTDPAYHRAR